MSLNAQTGKEIRVALEQALDNVLSEAYKTLPYDKIYYGILTGVDSLGINYTLSINDKIYTDVKRIQNCGVLSIGTPVICMAPQNQMTKLFILGAVQTTTQTAGQIAPILISITDSDINNVNGVSVPSVSDLVNESLLFTNHIKLQLQSGEYLNLPFTRKTSNNVYYSAVVDGQLWTLYTKGAENKVYITKSSMGIDTYDATASEADIALDKTAYAQGEKITGNINTYDGSYILEKE